MRKSNARLGIIAGVALLLGANAAHADLVQDGSFENATYTGGTTGSYVGAPGNLGDGWNVATGAIQVENAGDGYGVPYAGSQFAYLDYGSTTNTLSQALATAVGQSYTISFYVADDAPDPLEVTFGSDILFNGTAPTNGITSVGDYVLESFTGTASSTSTTLSFIGSYDSAASGNGTNLDNVSVTALSSPPAVPEPASLALLGTGVALLGLGRGRPRMTPRSAMSA